jgi:hypothetical protein
MHASGSSSCWCCGHVQRAEGIACRFRLFEDHPHLHGLYCCAAEINIKSRVEHINVQVQFGRSTDGENLFCCPPEKKLWGNTWNIK